MIKDKNYVTNTALDCFSSCLLNYFEYNGIKWSSEEAYIIGGGMNCLFDKNKQLSIKPDISVTEIYLNALKEMKVPFRFATCDQNQNEFMINCVKNEENIMVRLTTKGLKYASVFENNEEMGHFVNVIGYDDNKVYISDGYVPNRIVSTFLGEMPVEDFLDAWEKKLYTYVILDIDKENRSVVEKGMMSVDVKAFIKKSLQKFIDRNNNDNCGYKAVESFAYSLLDFAGKGDEEISKETYRIVYEMKLLGFLLSKECIKKFLSEHSVFEGFVADYSKILNSWNAILLKILKIKFYKGNTDYINDLIQQIISLNNKEIEFYTSIITLI